MSTSNFNLAKLAKTDGYDISQFNGNMDIIDTEMAKPPLTVNDIQPDAGRNIEITTVPLADNLTSDEVQINTGTYTIRTSGGEASIANGNAWLTEIVGHMVKTGAVAESIIPSITVGEDHLSIDFDRDTFVAYVSNSGTITLNYTNAWSANPTLYGVTVTGTPVNGDQITIVYVKESRGTITVANPSSFVSTGWNLYNHTTGYARVYDYSDEYGFMIEGTYTSLAFAETLSGTQTQISPVNGYFTVPGNGYVFVTGGNATSTAIWMAWGDWTEEPNGGVFEAYSQTTIDLSEVMALFPYGLMRVGNVYDEINLNIGQAISRIERLAYNDTNLENVIASGVSYDVDTGYIYAEKSMPTSYTIELDGEYTASDHGTELFIGTSVPVTASSLYGNDLKGKLRRDVVTISQQNLTDPQKAQVIANIGALSQTEFNSKNAYSNTSATISDLSNVPLNAQGRIKLGSSVSPIGSDLLCNFSCIGTSQYRVLTITNTYANNTYVISMQAGTWGKWYSASESSNTSLKGLTWGNAYTAGDSPSFQISSCGKTRQVSLLFAPKNSASDWVTVCTMNAGNIPLHTTYGFAMATDGTIKMIRANASTGVVEILNKTANTFYAEIVYIV